jgi:hypothetical protein
MPPTNKRSTIPVSASRITPESYTFFAHAALDQPQLRPVVLAAAKRLGEKVLDYGSADAAREAKRTTPAPTLALDQDPRDLMTNPARRGQLDALVRALAAETGATYPEALDKLHGAHAEAEATSLWSGPVTLERVAKAAGVQELAAFTTDVETFQRRDQEVVRLLDTASAALYAQPVDDRGRVLLDADFDIARLLHDPEARERRWREARELNNTYADRERWESDDLLHLEAGRDLLSTLSRPVRLAEARREADGQVRHLDAALQSASTASERAKALDAALAGEVRTLDEPSEPRDQEAQRVEAARLLGALTSEQLHASLDGFLKDGLSLENAVAQATSAHPSAPTGSDLASDDRVTARAELDAQVRRVIEAVPGMDYRRALERVTGVTFGPS